MAYIVGPKIEFPDITIHEVFRRQVERTPQAVALISEGIAITFLELDRRSNRIADILQDRNCSLESKIGVGLDRSIEAIVALLAVAKAGGTIVALDPNYPEARLHHIILDAQLTCLITTERLRSKFSCWSGPVLYVEQSDGVSVSGRALMLSAAGSQSALSVVYTSGSTGLPKGVVRLHRGIVSRLAWMPFESNDVWAQSLSLSVGFSESWLWIPLVSGVPLVVISDEKVRNPQQFLAEIRKNRVTGLAVTPSMLRYLLVCVTRGSEPPTTLRTVSVGSSTLGPDICDAFAKVLPGAELINEYGGTEAGAATRGPVEATRSRASIGRVVPNAKLLVLASDMRSTPIGQVGELYVGGTHIARGYLAQPALTASRFIALSPDDTPDLFYKTGDFVRVDEDGEIVFVGRTDRQVKLRGFRVELSEMEAVLGDYPGVAEVVVSTYEVDHEARAIAYIVPKVPKDTLLGDLYRFLKQRVPVHMIPASFVCLSALPLTWNGKLDWTKLPNPSKENLDPATVYEVAQTQVESDLVEIVSRLLRVDNVSMRDNFIQLGGDSLTAARVWAELGDRINERLSIDILFEGSIAEVARMMDIPKTRPV